MLHYPATDVILSHRKLSKNSFKQHIYDPILRTRINEEIQAFEANTMQFANHRKFAEQGRQAFEATIAPVFALMLSLIGAIVHTIKTILHFTEYTTGIYIRRALAKSALIVGVVISAFVFSPRWISTEITEHPTFQGWLHAIQEDDNIASVRIKNQLLTISLDALIRLDSVAYPVFKSTKNQFDTIKKKVGVSSNTLARIAQ